MEPNLFGQIAISLALGMLIGLQRERAESTIGGIRTFPLIAAFGTLCGWLALEHGGWIVAADKFRWVSGESQIRTWARASGFRSHFCSRCGSPVPNPLRDTGYVWVPSGLLEGDDPLEIGAQLYLGARAAWDDVPGGGRQFESAPEMAALITLLHERVA